jgi:predicted RNA-binding Zn ribbon-like protein
MTLMHPASQFLGSRLAVDFVNACYPAEELSWLDLLSFLEAAGIISPGRAAQLFDLPRTESETTDRFLHRAGRLRAALRQVFEAIAAGRSILPDSIETMNRVLRVTEGHDELVLTGNRWRLQFVAREESLDWLLAAAARSAAEIVSEGADAPIRACSNPNCGLLFYDESRNHQRRWCSMATCGNRHKVAAFAHRRSARAH